MQYVLSREDFFEKFNYELLNEGIDIDKKNRKVSINIEYEDGVITNNIINPTYSTINNYDVISIFKRKKLLNDSFDGNPLLYALKGLDGWKIDNKDILKLLKLFIKIVDTKISDNYDTIIKIPSSSELNTNFLFRLNRIIKCDNVINTLFRKLETWEVFNTCVDGKKFTDYQFDELMKGFEKMGDTFSFKYIPPYLRNYINKIWDDTYIGEEIDVADKINGKNILILDDTISSGQTISTYCDNIMEMYEPSKITVITLFSKI